MTERPWPPEAQEDAKHLPWLFRLATEALEARLREGDHPYDAASTGSAVIDAYFKARD